MSRCSGQLPGPRSRLQKPPPRVFIVEKGIRKAVYKQFTYARNAIQYNVEKLYLEKAVGVEKLNKLRYRDSIPLDMKFTGEELQRFRDSLTEGYNVTPNFFIRNGVPDGEINYSDPQLKANDKLKEDIQKQFEDRLFDRDTLLLREYYINLFFVMRAYATDEDWSDELHKIIREDLIKNLNRKYSFWRIYPKENPVPFVWIHFHEIIGKAYRTELFSDDIILAFEKTKEGEAHKAAIERSIKDDIIGEMKQFDLEPGYGSGFSKRQLHFSVQFYKAYPKVNALRSQLNWTQYRTLIQIADPDKREYYELEAANNGWTARELERQKNSLLYERLLKSNDKEAVLAFARGQRTPEALTEIVKDPMYLEFLGLEQKPSYYESDLEDALITHLQEFLLELGNGFSFVARQKRFLIEDDEYKVDLVFYNRLLRCFVLIDLKTHKATHQDLGQLRCTSTTTTGSRNCPTRIPPSASFSARRRTTPPSG